MTKFKNKYRNESARAQWWDYANAGAYFITICTAGRQYLFGEISNGEMDLSPIGEIVNREWDVSFDMRAELSCDAYVIMPNHIHAILRITNPLGTHGRASLQASTGAAYRSPKSISSFVAGFKSAATIRVNQFRRIASPPIPTGPVWQPRFHDHIIRDGYEYQRVYEYIGHNIVNWKNDRLMQLPAVK